MSTCPWTNHATAAALLLFAVSVAPKVGAADDDPLIADVNGHVIRESDVYAEIEGLPLGDQVAIRQRFDTFAESLVREEILFQSVLATDFASEPGLRESVKEAVVRHLIERHVTSRLEVTDAQARAFYEANASAIRGEEVRASQILMARREQCETLMKSIGSLDDFKRLARARSLHRDSALRDGDIGLFMNHDGPLGFESRLFNMRAGEMAVFDSEDGCHLVWVTERNTPPLPPFEDVEERIRALLMAQQERKLLSALIQGASEKVSVTRPPE